MADQAQQPQDTPSAPADTAVQTPTQDSQAPVVQDQGTQAPADAPVPPVTPPATEPTPAPVAQATQGKFQANKAKAPPAQDVAQQEPTFEDLIANLKENGTVHQRGLITAVEQYLETLAPGKPVDGDVGARVQYGFWKTISNVLEHATSVEFKSLWNILLGYFHAHKEGALHDRYVFRFSEHWAQSESELTAFQRIVNLIKLTANPATRAQSLKQVDLQRTLADGLTETARQRVLMFYK